ncbi:MAG: NUDIX hydrolase [Bacteroidetes bacterium]|nr:NUDIX hydrolase [Bacteroidota bacterium]
MTKEKLWKVISTEKGFSGDWINVDLDRIELPDKKEITFEAVKFERNGAGIAARNKEGKYILVKNYRYINDFESWEIPAGTIPPDSEPSECIVEELKEEAGCEVSKNDLKYLGYYFPSIGSSNQEFHCFTAENVKQVTDDFDRNEIIETGWFSKDEILKMISDGVIKDGFSITLLLRSIFTGR